MGLAGLHFTVSKTGKVRFDSRIGSPIIKVITILIRDYPIVKKIHQLLIDDGVDFSDELDYYDLASTIIGSLPRWPQIDGENLDLENCNYYEINPENIVLIAGGDWQEGMTLKIFLNDNSLDFEILPFDHQREFLKYDTVIEVFTPAQNDSSDSN